MINGQSTLAFSISNHEHQTEGFFKAPLQYCLFQADILAIIWNIISDDPIKYAWDEASLTYFRAVQ